MYKCPECGEIFDEPNYMEICWEDYYGVSSMFPNRNYGVVAKCPKCGIPINEEYDTYDEEGENEWED